MSSSGSPSDFIPEFSLAGNSTLLDVVTGCLRIFVSGAETHVGKTTVCLSLLHTLRSAGFSASELAYVKPATQCEAPDLLSEWCSVEGIEYVSGEQAPLVFYAGFTRSFLEGKQGTSADWLSRIETRIDELARCRKVVIVDGVGFPAVGSIVGVDNADVAKAARSPVLLVCKCGVGSAIDSFSLNKSYFLAKGVPVLGAVFNFGDVEGYYAWDKCLLSIEMWFQSQTQRCYGVVPKLKELDGLRELVSETDKSRLSVLAEINAAHFAQHVDLAALITDGVRARWCDLGEISRKAKSTLAKSAPAKVAGREEVTETAVMAGAKGGG